MFITIELLEEETEFLLDTLINLKEDKDFSPNKDMVKELIKVITDKL